jgi:uncharacterized protein YcbK (DUF882 family)
VIRRRAAYALAAALAALPVPAPLASEPPPTTEPEKAAPAPIAEPAAVSAAASATAPVSAPAPVSASASPPLATLVHGHTLETLPLDDTGPSVERFSAFLADREFERSTTMDARLIDMLRAIARKHRGARIEILSGYRSPKRNELLRKKGHHVASHSQHTLGTAIDFRIDGLPLGRLAGEIMQMKWDGGLGIYPGRRDRFVHVDTGPKRRWSGW